MPPDEPSNEIQFDASNHTAALVAASMVIPSYRTERFRWIAEARSLAVQVTLDTLCPVISELIDGPERTVIGASGVRATVTNVGVAQKKAVVFDDPRGECSMAVGLGSGNGMSVAFFGRDGISADQAVEAVHARRRTLPVIATLPKIGGSMILSDTSPGRHDIAIHAASALAGYLKEILPVATEAAVSAARSGNRYAYVTPDADNPFIRATAAALSVDGFVAWGCVGATLDLLWFDTLTAEFAGRVDKITELTAALMNTHGAGYDEDEASWVVETPDGAALVLLASDDVGVRIEISGDTLAATLVDIETGALIENIAVVNGISSGSPEIVPNGGYSSKMTHYLGDKAFFYLDDHHESLCINAKRATSPSP